ncbi:MAG: hypothetical protein K2L95_04375 [Alphaproteobacteria bacterium]|nr:hypothetical protein [Alphaproteobacteria bacterium]MDE6571420.1 hypothetical protein [Alphaproteobacteria bacterium]
MADKNSPNHEITFGARPKMRLNLMDKIYLATAMRDADATKYVYSLYLMGRGGAYTSETSVEVTAFDDEHQAQAYFDTIIDVVDVYQNHPVVRQMNPILAPRIQVFEDMFKTR